MSATARPASAGDDSNFLAQSGLDIARRLLRDRVPFDIHDCQLEGACAAVSGKDLLGCIPTGGGKTVLLFLPMLLIDSIHKDPTLPQSLKKRFPANPVMIAVFPTNVLEVEKADEFQRLGLKMIPINSNTLGEAQQRGENLWQTARRADVYIVLLSPEQLVSKGFEGLLQDSFFYRRIWFMGVDEIHLLDIWGALFRKVFQQIGFMRARLPERTVLIGLSATLLAGERTHNVCRFLGLKAGKYHAIRRSNMRYDLQLLIREVPALGLGLA